MNYPEAMQYLETAGKKGSVLGLDTIRRLMKELGNVQEKLNIVHVAGTNGKGSICAMVSAALIASGYKTGRFSTPDVFSYEEIFSVDGEPISKKRLAELVTEISQAAVRMEERMEAAPTRFEIETAVAFLWFFQEGCDVAVIETGMGGETDATNLITKPLVSILTPVSMDHMSFLGSSRKEIAKVKAGIIKKGRPLVTACQQEDVMKEILGRCQETGSKFVVADARNADVEKYWLGGFCFSYRFSAGAYGSLPEVIAGLAMQLSGQFQVGNAAVALEALKILSDTFPSVSEQNIRAAFSRLRFPGRFEVLGERPYFILDGAHNADAAERLCESLQLLAQGRNIFYIMSVLADKEYLRIAETVLSPGSRVFTVTSPNPRALDGKKLAAALREIGMDAEYQPSAEAAVESALAEAGEEDVVLAFGTLSYLKEIRLAYEHVGMELP